MNELWKRVLLPLLIPVVSLAVIVVVVLNFSRMLIALEERYSPEWSTAFAIIVGASVLFACAYFASRRMIRSTGHPMVLASAGIVVVFGGLTGAEAIYDHEQEEKAHAEEEEPAAEVAATVTAVDINFKEKEISVPAGGAIEYVNEGAILHTLLIEGVSGFMLSVPSQGATDVGVPEVEPGTYTYYCDVAGHRSAGMEGTMTVTEGGAAGEGGGGGGGGGGAVDVVAQDIKWGAPEVSVPSGGTINLVNEGAIAHTLVVEGVSGFQKLEVAAKGDTAEGKIEAEPGEYVFFCDVAGHRAAGMEGTLTVT
ncbi:MAG: plastocyanin/azurin family copper-binding protein [Acidimicrobiia bacterium]